MQDKDNVRMKLAEVSSNLFNLALSPVFNVVIWLSIAQFYFHY